MSSSKKTTAVVSPTTFLNSGSKQFTAQQASINKIIFFNQQNNLEYQQYLDSNFNNNNINPPNPSPNSNFPVQYTGPYPQFVFHANGTL